MRETPVFSAKTWKGSRTLRFMSAGCGMGDLRFRRRLRQRCGFGFLLGLGNRPDHIEGAFRIVFEFIAQDSLAAIERVFETDEFSFDSAKLLGREERLGEKMLE